MRKRFIFFEVSLKAESQVIFALPKCFRTRLNAGCGFPERPNMSSFTYPREYLDTLNGGSAASRLVESFGGSASQREYENSIASRTSIEKLTQSLGLASQVRDYAKDFAHLTSSKTLFDALRVHTLEHESATATLEQNTARMLENALGGGAAMREYAKAMDITSQVKKLAAGLDFGTASIRYLKDIESVSASSKLAESFGGVAALKAAESAGWIQQLSKSMVDEDLYRRFLGTLDVRQTISGDLWLTAAEIAKHRYDKLFSVSDVWARQIEMLQRPEYLESLLSTIERDVSAHAYEGDDLYSDEGEDEGGEILLNELAQADSPEHFANILSRCPPWLKWALIVLLVQVVLPHMNGISVNLITPHVEQYLHQSPAVPQRQQVKEIRKLSMGELGVELRDYRFVTTSTLALRANANGKSAQVGTLQLGQVVAVVSSKRDWTEVVYEYGDGQTISGWVFTRYTEKFRR
jgi:hypothetical protein